MVTLWNLIENDTACLDGVVLPDGMDVDVMKDTMVREWGDCDVVWGNPKIFAHYNAQWFRSHQYSINALWKSTQMVYDPIENYNRYESYGERNDDVENRNARDTFNGSVGVNGTVNDTGSVTDQNTRNETIAASQNSSAESFVSPYNAETYVEESKTTSNNGSDSNTTVNDNNVKTLDTHQSEKSDTVTENVGLNETTVNNNRQKTGDSHVHGNIGVTTTQQMLQQERDIAHYDVYLDVAQMWGADMIVQCW